MIFDSIMNNKFFHIFLYSMNAYECKLLIRYVKSIKITDASRVPVSLFDRFVDFINTSIMDTPASSN